MSYISPLGLSKYAEMVFKAGPPHTSLESVNKFLSIGIAFIVAGATDLILASILKLNSVLPCSISCSILIPSYLQVLEA